MGLLLLAQADKGQHEQRHLVGSHSRRSMSTSATALLPADVGALNTRLRPFSTPG